MLVDVGTNTEVVLRRRRPHGRRVLPGRSGLRGRPRHLRHDRLRRRHRSGRRWTPAAPWRYRTIGDAPARGICGSGLIDLLAELRRHGPDDAKGMFADSARVLHRSCPSRASRSRARTPAIWRRPRRPTTAASSSSCATSASTRRDIERLYLAGGFANYIDVAQRDRDRLPGAGAGGSHREGRQCVAARARARCCSRRRARSA